MKKTFGIKSKSVWVIIEHVCITKVSKHTYRTVDVQHFEHIFAFFPRTNARTFKQLLFTYAFSRTHTLHIHIFKGTYFMHTHFQGQILFTYAFLSTHTFHMRIFKDRQAYCTFHIRIFRNTHFEEATIIPLHILQDAHFPYMYIQ